MVMLSRGLAGKSAVPAAGPLDVFTWFSGVEVPDPITFVMSPEWLNRPNLYPRQATLLKVIFLRDDLFTDFDHEVIAEWVENFTQTGDNGISPDIYERIAYLKARGYGWFREVLLALGRRAGKGYVSALAMSYIMWNYMAKGDPQEHYGVDRDKQLTCMIFAGKKEQAKENLWGDLYNVITGAPCFAPYVSSAQGESLTVYAPHDFVRIASLEKRGIKTTKDQATFVILPKESTGLAGRGPASFMMGFDEQAHVVKATAKADAKDVYDGATPSLDQFGKDGFIVAPSSTWQMIGQFYESCTQATAIDEETGAPLYPSKFIIQLASWEIYYDWERAYLTPVFPDGFTGDLGEYADITDGPPAYFNALRGAIQAYDEEMQRLEMANPDTFAVERKSKWAAVLDAYLNEAKVKQIFAPWTGRPEQYGPALLRMQSQGVMTYTYKAHGDPAQVNCMFGFAVAHEEQVPQLDPDGSPAIDKRTGQPIMISHAVFDLIHHWDPADFPNHTLDYDVIMDWIWDHVCVPFMPDELTFDQWNNVATIPRLQKKVRDNPLPKQILVSEKTATGPLNWKRFETFKAAVNMGLVHCFAGETRYLTPEGPKVLAETAGTSQRVLDRSGEWVDAQIRSFGVQPLYKVVLRRNQAEKIIYATAGHRWVTVPLGRKYRSAKQDGVFKTTTELVEGTRLAWMKPRSRIGNVTPSAIGIMHGAVFGDGYVGTAGSRITLWRDKDLQLLRYFPESLPRVPCETPNGIKGVRVGSLPRYFKDAPSLDEAPSYLYGWLAGYFAADGTVGATGQATISSVSRESIELVKRVCDRLGIAYGSVVTKRMCSDFAVSEHCYELTLAREGLRDDFFLIEEHRDRFVANPGSRSRIGWTVVSVEETERVEEVYCAVVPSTATFTLEDHLLTGNCPYYEQAQNELVFLQKKEGDKVDHPDAGPVQTKDVADCLVEVTYTLLGEQMNNFLGRDLRNLRPAGGMQGGVQPFPEMDGWQDGGVPNQVEQLNNFGRQMAQRARFGGGLARGVRRVG